MKSYLIIYGLVGGFLFFQNSIQKNVETLHYNVDDFKKMKKFDTHVHIYTEDASLIKQAEEDNFHLIDINGYLFPGSPEIEEQQAISVDHINDFPKQIHYVTTISVKNFHEEGWEEETINYLKKSFAQGAIGVKVWKNIGMELKDKDGGLIMIDDPKFDPVLDFIAKNGKTLFSHQGEPKDCWLPLDEMKLNKNYYSRNPQYHMYGRADYPSYEDQINARDHMVEKHPELRIVSVHLASLEWSVDEISKRLDKYPNLAIDVSARISSLQYQSVTDWQKVHDFFLKYQDRILYGSDITVTKENIDPLAVRQNAHKRWINDWEFFTTNNPLSSSGFEGKFRGLILPREVVDKIYFENAEKWIPALLKE